MYREKEWINGHITYNVTKLDICNLLHMLQQG